MATVPAKPPPLRYSYNSEPPRMRASINVRSVRNPRDCKPQWHRRSAVLSSRRHTNRGWPTIILGMSRLCPFLPRLSVYSDLSQVLTFLVLVPGEDFGPQETLVALSLTLPTSRPFTFAILFHRSSLCCFNYFSWMVQFAGMNWTVRVCEALGGPKHKEARLLQVA